jgi:hypothetical protein
LIHWLLVSTQIWGFYFMGENWIPIHLCIIYTFELYIEITINKCKFVEIIEVWIYHTIQKMVYIICSTTIGVLRFEDQAWSKNWNTLWIFVHLVYEAWKVVGCCSNMIIKGWDKCGLIITFEKKFNHKPWKPMDIVPFLLV